MSKDIVAATARRISEHARVHKLSSVQVILHGGEPLLAGSEVIDFTAGVLRAMLGGDVALDLRIQTNGTLLDVGSLSMLQAHRIKIGISLDGDAISNDRHRRYRDGRGSYPAVTRGLTLLADRRYRPLFAGLLCTIELLNDPIRVYEGLLEFAPPFIDFLLPHGNWTTRPPGRAEDGETAYADWLIPIFDRWYRTPAPRTGIRSFQSIINLAVGRPSLSEAFGLAPICLVVIETDGSIQQVDSLKSAFDGAPETGLNVMSDSFDRALDFPAVAARQIGVAGLCETCSECSVRNICGGGLYTHRYRVGAGFRNPSVYCPDLQALIAHIQDTIRTDLAAVGAGR